LCVSAAVLLRTEYNNEVLLKPNTTEKIIKIATFNAVGILTPLYEEKSTIVESNTTIAANSPY
jgi:hypothetical protein